MSSTIDPNKLYTKKELSKILGVHERTITLMVNRGQLPNTKAGTKYLFSGKAVLKSLE